MICCRFRRLDFGKTILAGICYSSDLDHNSVCDTRFTNLSDRSL